ncbi:MAG: hypothetical protein IKL24_07085 [Clostridia bacterium]|nr:hypothetical protein [Clostridia bacterium]
MKEERIIDALSDIDEKLIMEANALRNKKRRIFPARKASLIAACAALVFLCAFLIPILQRSTENSVKPPVGEGEIIGNDTDTETKSESEYTDCVTEAPEEKPDMPEADDNGSHPPETENESTIIPEPDGGVDNNSSQSGGEMSADGEKVNSMNVTVLRITEDGFICRPADTEIENESIDSASDIYVICTLDISNLAEGSTVTVYYTSDENSHNTLHAYHIELQKGDQP